MTTESGAPVEAGASTPAGFEIEGKLYSFPRIDTITLDEERILYVYADTVLQDFTPAHPEMSKDEQIMYETLQMRKIRNPDFKRALAHIAYKRENPHVQDSDIQVTIGGVSALEVDLALLRGDDDDPPAMTSQKPLESKSDINELSRPTDSGSPTEQSSAQVVDLHAATGTTELETSSRGAVQTELVS
jgi:hypothetical protein